VVLPTRNLIKSHELFDVTRQVSVKEPERHLNIMLISVESLSGDYLTAFGSKDNITPRTR
jgi:hypothetical protein